MKKRKQEDQVTVIRTGIDRQASIPFGGVLIAVTTDGWWSTRNDAWKRMIREVVRHAESKPSTSAETIAIVSELAANRDDLFEIVEVS